MSSRAFVIAALASTQAMAAPCDQARPLDEGATAPPPPAPPWHAHPLVRMATGVALFAAGVWLGSAL